MADDPTLSDEEKEAGLDSTKRRQDSTNERC